MVRSQTLVIITTAAALLGGCSNIGSMFSKSGPERQINEAVVPEVKETLRNLPKGLVADKADARHTGQTLVPQ
ncbi:hypothetical protein [Govanella unica]|uniref:Uncharacterized protein n=1 Tax=Govanella unica TaxID=2975056 RepID=A0A9X3U0W9_9PROT|nr:hypothetical protein [Govania unica]MDA5195068.1 hypothetical protein [Govania unica]